MRKLLFKWLVNVISLVAVAAIVRGISIKLWPAAAIAAFVIIALNAFLRPVLLFLTWPLTLFTLGLFTIFINGLIFLISSRIVNGFEVSGVWTACLGSLLMSVVNFILAIFLSPSDNLRFGVYSPGGAPDTERKNYSDVIDAEIKEEK